MNSSVLDSELFDAFPSVPENYPLVLPPSQLYSTTTSHSQSHSPASVSPMSSYLPSPQFDQPGAMVGSLESSFDASLISSAAHLHGEQGGRGGGGGGFLSANTDSGGSGFVPLVSPWSPLESANTVNGAHSHVNGTAKALNGIPPSR